MALTKSLSSLDGQPDCKAVASESKKQLKAVVFILNSLIWVHPWKIMRCPNQIVLVGRSPAHIVPFGYT